MIDTILRVVIVSKNKVSGFMFVELLVVIVVIAILAAITIVAYMGISTRTKQSSASNDVDIILKKAEVYRTIAGAYPSGPYDY